MFGQRLGDREQVRGGAATARAVPEDERGPGACAGYSKPCRAFAGGDLDHDAGRGSSNCGPLCLTLLTSVLTGYASSPVAIAGTTMSSAGGPCGSSHFAQFSRGTSNGIRSWIWPRASGAEVVRMAVLTSQSSPSFQNSNSPAIANDAPSGAMDVERLLGHTLSGVPLVVAVGRQQTASFRPGAPERGLLGSGLDPGIDHPVADLRVLRPRRDGAPLRDPQLPLHAIVGLPVDDHVDRLARRDVVVRGRFSSGGRTTSNSSTREATSLAAAYLPHMGPSQHGRLGAFPTEGRESPPPRM